LVNVADTPQYCDFYLGGIVTKGNLKIAISTNGKSPTTANGSASYWKKYFPKRSTTYWKISMHTVIPSKGILSIRLKQ
jgi:precorrin-2 dehydrogenase / sirohydrochlorin ferrochelatase